VAQFLYEIVELHFMLNRVTTTKYTCMQDDVFKAAWLKIQFFWNGTLCRGVNDFRSFVDSNCEMTDVIHNF
jgi:hypothetical protein